MLDAAAVVRQLRSPRRTEQLRAAEVVLALVRAGRQEADEQRRALVAAGALPPLVQLLSASSQAVQTHSVLALLFIASAGWRTQVRQAFLGSGGGISALVALANLRGPGLRGQAHMGAAGLLQRMADQPGCLPAMLVAGAVPALLRLWAERALLDPAVVGSTLGALCAVAGQPDGASALAAGDPIPWLMHALQMQIDARRRSSSSNNSSSSSSSSGSSSSSSAPFPVEDAAAALVRLVHARPELAAAAAAAGAPAALVRLLVCQSEHAELLAALGTLGLCGAAEAVAAAGGLAAFVGTIASSSCSADADAPDEFNAVAGLRDCLHACPELRAAAAATGAAPALLRLAGHGPEHVRAFAAEALQLLSAPAAASHDSHGPLMPAHRPSTGKPKQQQRPPRACAAPGCNTTAGLRLCGGCGAVRYCSEACSRAHWREHRADCRRLQADQKGASGSHGGGTAAGGACAGSSS